MSQGYQASYQTAALENLMCKVWRYVEETRLYRLEKADTTSVVNDEGMITISASVRDDMVSTIKTLRKEQKALLLKHDKDCPALLI